MTTARRGSKGRGAVVSLHELVGAIEAQTDSMSSYVDLITGEIYVISEEAFRLADEETACDAILPEWQKEEVEWARRISSGDHYLALPSSWDLHEWTIVRQFCCSLPDDRLRGEFLTAIHGPGSFRRFKSQVTHHGLWESWNQFRLLAIRDRLIEWCQEHGVPFLA
jgi:Uncharacterised protein family (UPF0158)